MAPKTSSPAKPNDARLTAFAACYLETRDATASARRAGYRNPARTAQQLLATSSMQALIEELRLAIQDPPAELSYEFLDENLLQVLRTSHNHPFRGYKDRVDALRLAYEILGFRQEQMRTGVSSIGSAPETESDSAAAPAFYVPQRKRGEDGIVCRESEEVEKRLLGQGSTGGGCTDGGTTAGVGAKDEGTGDSA